MKRHTSSALPLLAVFGVAAASAVLLTGAPGAGFKANGPEPVFYEVAKKLDVGGDVLTINVFRDDLTQALDKLKGRLGAEGDRAEVGKMLTIAEPLARGLGLDRVKAAGSSLIKTDLGYRSKTYARVDDPRSGVFALLGAKPHSQTMLKYAPADTIVFGSIDLDIAKAPELARSLARDHIEGVSVEDVDGALSKLSSKMKMDVRKALASCGGQFAVIATVDATERLPVGGGSGPKKEIPVPRIAVLAQVKDSGLYDQLLAALGAAAGKFRETSTPGSKRVEFLRANGESYEGSPGLVLAGDLTILTSNLPYADRLLETAKGGQNLANQAEFQKAARGLPTLSNGMVFVSQRFDQELRGAAEAVLSVVDVLRAKLGGPPVGPVKPSFGQAVAELIPSMGPAASVRVNEAEGFYMVSNRPRPEGAEGVPVTSYLATPWVVPVVAITGLIALPNYLEAQMRAKVARVKADQRSLATGLEAFFVDHNRYPEYASGKDGANSFLQPGKAAYGATTFRTVPGPASPRPGGTYFHLTTPVAYLTGYPPDPFAGEPKATYGYFQKGNGWILYSPGPDLQYDFTPEALAAIEDFGKPGIRRELVRYTYDPTNGTASAGDVFRVSQRAWRAPPRVGPPRFGPPGPARPPRPPRTPKPQIPAGF